MAFFVNFETVNFVACVAFVVKLMACVAIVINFLACVAFCTNFVACVAIVITFVACVAIFVSFGACAANDDSVAYAVIIVIIKFVTCAVLVIWWQGNFLCNVYWLSALLFFWILNIVNLIAWVTH